MKKPTIKQIELNSYLLNSMRQCVLLQPLSADQFDEIVEASHAVQLADNDTIFERGGRSLQQFIVLFLVE